MNKRIPKTIHYCWFGRGRKSTVFERCLASWQQCLPGYEIKEWNEDNFELDCPFTQGAYQMGKYAFVSDYARFKILYEYGGLYLDTDMLLLEKIPEAWSQIPFYIGAESPTIVNASIIGAVKGHQIPLFFLRKYQKDYPSRPTKFPIVPSLLTAYFNAKGEMSFTKETTRKEYTIFPPEYFYPIAFPPEKNARYQDYMTPRTIGVHLWEGTWLDAKDYFNIGDCEKGMGKLEEEGKNIFPLRAYWWMYCKCKNALRPIYRKLIKR